MYEFVIKKAKRDDLREILRLLKEAAIWLQNKNINYWHDWINPPPNFYNWVKSGLENDEFYLVEREGSIIGCLRLKWNDELFWGIQKEPAGYIHSFTIDRKLLGKNIGRNVLNKIEQNCKEINMKYLRLDCSSEVPALRKYYENCGFLPVGETTVNGERLTLYEKEII
jgi:N-acetylglutamate synthase-like GNAT family acetyltransferase